MAKPNPGRAGRAAATAGAPPDPEPRRPSEERFRMLVEGVRDYAIFLLDPEGHVTSWNTGAERLKQYRAEEIIGKHFSIFYPAEAVAGDWPGTELRLAARDGRFEDEGWRVRKDGTQFWANVVITAMRDGTQRMPSLSHACLVITSLQRGLGGGMKIPSGALAIFSLLPNTPM